MWFLNTSDFPARWHCGNWSAFLGWLHIGSDLATWGAYLAIPIVILFFILRGREIPFRSVWWLFGAFILLCGTGHLIEALIFWWPVYRLAGIFKLMTAAVSWATVVALVPTVPKLLSRPSHAELQEEISRREKLEQELRMAHEELEQRVAQRTQELAAANAVLAQHAAIVSSSQDAIIGLDLTGKIRTWNQGATSIYGYEEEEIRGSNMDLLYTEDSKAEWGSSLERLLAGQRTELTETFHKDKTGQHKRVSISLSPISDDDGELTGIAAISHDITQQKIDEEMFRHAVESSPNGKVMIDAQGTIVLANAHLAAMFGYQKGELLGQPIELLVPKEHKGDHPGLREGYLDDMKPRKMGTGRDLAGQKKDGTMVPVEIGLNPIETLTGSFILGSVVDITERKKFEKELQRKNRDLQTLLFVASHDLREPLRAVRNFSKLVVERYAAQLDTKGRDFLKRVMRAAERMNRLIDDLLSLSRARSFELPTESASGEEIIEEALRRLEHTIQQAGATIEIKRPIPPLRADPRWATEALYNLIANALKFTEEGKAPEILVEGYADPEKGDILGFIVHDRGPGISTKHTERIFELFQRAVGREIEGNGAGLAIVRQIAERHGGSAWMHPREGGGSSFFVTFSK